LWEATAVDTLEKNRFYFENLINGTWREHALYSLDNRLLKRETSRLAVEVHVVVLVIPNNAPPEAIGGVTAIWNAAKAADKYPLLLVVNGNPEDFAPPKLSVPSQDIIYITLNESQKPKSIPLLRAIHQIISRGEITLQQKRNNSSFRENTKPQTVSYYKHLIIFAFFLIMLMCMLLHVMFYVYCEGIYELSSV